MNKFKVIIIGLVFLAPSFLYGAEVIVESLSNEYALGKEFNVDIYLDAEGDSINAIEGKLLFAPSILQVVAIKDGNSSVNFWINKPSLTEKNEVSFSGVTPGGIRGDDRHLFSIVFKPIKTGSSSVQIKDVVSLKNDGLGTRASTKAGGLSIEVVPIVVDVDSNVAITDTREPETFLPVIGRDTEIYDGMSFIVFSTQDKESGIEYYEVKEGVFGRYVRTVSPYVLNNQDLDKKIYVKAVDMSGNTRVISIRPENYRNWYKRPEILGIIVIVILAAFYNRKKCFNLAEKL